MMPERPDNQILLALSAEDFHQLSCGLRPYDLDAGTVLYEPEDRVGVVWFPESGLITIRSPMLSGESVTTSIIGREGGAGLLEACGAGRTFSRAVVQAAGRFFRLPADAYCARLDESKALRGVIQAYSQLLLVESRQLIACHARHAGSRRLAWLLLALRDGLGGCPKLPVTQDDLADMLAAQRTTVSSFAIELRTAGAIDYRRGSIQIIDPERLAKAACSCRATVAKIRQASGMEAAAEARWA